MRAALAEIERRHGSQGRLRIDTSPADALAQVERDRLLADCIEAMEAIGTVGWSQRQGALVERFAAMGGAHG